MTCADTIFMRCHRTDCDYTIEKRVEHNEQLTPSQMIEWHERMIKHIRKVHSRAKA